jgi:hypothetical protein
MVELKSSNPESLGTARTTHYIEPTEYLEASFFLVG